MAGDEFESIERSIRATLKSAHPLKRADGLRDMPKPMKEQVHAIFESAKPVARPVVLDKATELKKRRTRHFALGLFFVAIFLVSLAAVLPKEDTWLWAGFGGLLLVVAAWYWDKSRPDIN